MLLPAPVLLASIAQSAIEPDAQLIEELGNVCRRDAASRDHKRVDLLGQQAVIGNLVGRWGWKVGLFVVIYPLIYFGFGFLPWSSAAVRESYATWALTNEPVAVLLAFNA